MRQLPLFKKNVLALKIILLVPIPVSAPDALPPWLWAQPIQNLPKGYFYRLWDIYFLINPKAKMKESRLMRCVMPSPPIS
jgi:hypothetical protein